MELTQANIEMLAESLKINDFNKAMKDASDYLKIAEDLMRSNPNMSIDELADLYEEQCRQAEATRESETVEMDEK